MLNKMTRNVLLAAMAARRCYARAAVRRTAGALTTGWLSRVQAFLRRYQRKPGHFGRLPMRLRTFAIASPGPFSLTRRINLLLHPRLTLQLNRRQQTIRESSHTMFTARTGFAGQAPAARSPQRLRSARTIIQERVEYRPTPSTELPGPLPGLHPQPVRTRFHTRFTDRTDTVAAAWKPRFISARRFRNPAAAADAAPQFASGRAQALSHPSRKARSYGEMDMPGWNDGESPEAGVRPVRAAPRIEDRSVTPVVRHWKSGTAAPERRQPAAGQDTFEAIPKGRPRRQSGNPPAQVDVDVVARQVMQQIDHRLKAWRERTGRF